MKTQNPWMGRARGSAGNMTSSKVYDKNVMRAKAFEVNNPKTTAQTNERNFFAECQDFCSKTSEETLRRIFSLKPKSKSRRNELLSQILKCSSISVNRKVLNLSKLESVGNGPKVNTPFMNSLSVYDELGFTPTQEMFGSNASVDSTLFFVAYNEDKGVQIINTGCSYEDLSAQSTLGSLGITDEAEYFGYLTIAVDGKWYNPGEDSNITVKTRAV